MNFSKKTNLNEPTKKESSFTTINKERIIKLIKDYFLIRLEPADYIDILAEALGSIKSIQNTNSEKASIIFSQFNETLHELLSDKNEIINLTPEHKNLEACKWWDRSIPLNDLILKNQLPTSDQVEKEIVSILLKKPVTLYNIDTQICSKFKGSFTPSKEFIKHCLDSYSNASDSNPELYHLREQDIPSNRINDLNKMQKFIIQIGSNLGFIPKEMNVNSKKIPSPILWYSNKTENHYLFYFSASAIISKIILLDWQQIMGQHKIIYEFLNKYIVLPGSRANLINYKLKQNPLLSIAAENNWHLIKFRHIRNLINTTHFDIDNLDSNLIMDPFEKTDPQLPLF